METVCYQVAYGWYSGIHKFCCSCTTCSLRCKWWQSILFFNNAFGGFYAHNSKKYLLTVSTGWKWNWLLQKAQGPHQLFATCSLLANVMVQMWLHIWTTSGPSFTTKSVPQPGYLLGSHLCQRKYADWIMHWETYCVPHCPHAHTY